MKLTWFGGHTLRVQVGGEIIVFDPDKGPAGTERAEIAGGADQEFRWEGPFWNADAQTWRPRRVDALAPEAERVRVHLLAFNARLIDAPGEPPLLLMGALDGAGRWARDATVVAFSPDAARSALRELGPRLIALALTDPELSATFSEMAGHLDGTGLVSLEPGLALEV
jgi:hypothetical protein